MKKFLSILLTTCLFVVSIVPVMAVENNETATYLMGDVDLDGRITVKDATLIQKFVAALEDLHPNKYAVADVDNNGNVNVKDATMIQKKIAGIINEFPVRDEESKDEVTTTPDETIPEKPTKPEPTEPPTETPTETPIESEPTEPPTEMPTETPVEPEPTEPIIPNMENLGPIDSIEGDEITPEMLWIIEEEFFRLVNEERVNNGVAPLTYNKHLDEVAQIRSAEIIEKFDHIRPDGTRYKTAIDTNKYPYIACGENICAVYHFGEYYAPFDGSEEQMRIAGAYAFEVFKTSPGHYNNLLYYGYTNAGIGISYIWDAEREAFRFYISHNFGSLEWIYPE